jgi:hypothetical protein
MKPLIIPAHISDQVQLLDLGIFAIHKMEWRLVHPHLDLNDQTAKLIKMLCEFQKAATATNIIGTFRKVGIMSQQNAGPGKLMYFLDRENAPDVRHWSRTRKRVTLEVFPGGP